MFMSVVRCPRIVKNARRVSKDFVATLKSTGRRFPTAGESGVEQLSIRRLVAPDGDRRHRSESCGVVNEITALKRDQYVVGVFVLR